jgi:amino acid transporter
MKTSPLYMQRPLPYNHPLMRLRNIFLGHPLKTSSQDREALGFWLGLPLLAIDALSSMAYATEEILLALTVLGTSYYHFSVPIAFVIVILMTSIIASYVQTVQAYPEGGGAYVVAKNHLSWSAWSLIAASSLLVDYILTVAVSVTAGVRALISAYPQWIGYNTSFSLVVISVMIWINLRGIRESAKAVAIPVYAFIVSILFLGVSGFFVSSDIQPVETNSTPVLDLAAFAVILRAFAGGCTAMTGIEVIANAGSILKKPHAVVARKILFALGILLGGGFLAITMSVQKLGLVPEMNESLISILARKSLGTGVIYQSVQILTACVLFLAANSAFAGFPKLTAMLAQDSRLPKQFSAVGDRLVFSNGIISLGLAAIVLVIIFNGDTHALIPLYAIGVFMAFTLSQFGMFHYWLGRKKRESSIYVNQNKIGASSEYRWDMVKAHITAFGTFLTFIALVVTFEAKFSQGAYIVLIIILLFSFLFWAISKHYKKFALLLEINRKMIKEKHHHFSQSGNRPIVVPVSRLHKGSLEALAFARQLSKDVRALIIEIGQSDIKETKKAIEDLEWDIKVVTIHSPYRSIIQPVVDYVHSVDSMYKDLTVLVLPELIPSHWWQNLLHNKTSKSINKALTWNEYVLDQARIIIHVPYYLK